MTCEANDGTRTEERASITLARGVEAARHSLGLTTTDLAEHAGCSPQHVTNIENRLRNPRQALISEVADALGKTPAELYQLGEIQLELETLDFVRERRRQVREEQDLKAMLETLADLGGTSLSKLAEAVQRALDR